MTKSLSLKIDGEPVCFANEPGDPAATYYLAKNHIHMQVHHGIKDVKGNDDIVYLFSKSLSLENEVNIQFLDSDQPTVRGEMILTATRHVYLTQPGITLSVKKNNFVLEEFVITNKACFIADVLLYPQYKNYLLKIYFTDDVDDEDKEAYRTDYPIEVDDEINIAFDKLEQAA